MDATSRNQAEIRTRDAERTKLEIRRAALAEFADSGMNGATMDQIAVRAKVDKKLIYYYFGSKEKLFLSALELTYADIRQAELELHLERYEPAEAVKRLLNFTWEHYLKHPEFLKLLNSENLHRAKHLKQSDQIREMNSPLIRLLGEIIERGRVEGVFRGGVDPVQLYISIAGICYFYLSNSATLSVIFGRELMAPKALSERLSHMTDVVMGYLLR